MPVGNRVGSSSTRGKAALARARSDQDPDLFTRDPKQAAQLGKARAGAESALRRAEEDWLEASSQFDEAAG